MYKKRWRIHFQVLHAGEVPFWSALFIKDSPKTQRFAKVLHSELRTRQKVKKNIIRVKNKGLESNFKGITKEKP